MSKPIKLLEEVSMNISNEEKMQREDAKKELFSYQELVTITPPDWMPASAISEWDRLVPIMKKRISIIRNGLWLVNLLLLGIFKDKNC